MKNRKKYTGFLLALVMCLSLAACGESNEPDVGGTDWRTTGIWRSGGTITRGAEDTDVLVCVHKADATFYYDTEDQTVFGSVDYPITLVGDAWEMFQGIDFADRNGDGNSDVTMRFDDGGNGLLIHFYDGKSSTSRQLSATLLELNLKKLIHFQTTAGDAEFLLNEQLGEELFPSDAPQEAADPAQGQEHTPDCQELLWNFLRNAADGSGRISIKDLQKYIMDNRNAALDFRRNFWDAVDREVSKWVKTVDMKANPPRNSKYLLLFAAVPGLLAMLICMFSTLYDGIQFGFSLLVGLIAFVVAVIILFVVQFMICVVIECSGCRVLDQQSEDDMALWEAFGRFLDDFTTFEDKELPEFSVWREYMVYAVAMGHGQKVAKALAVKYPEAVSTGTDALDDDMNRWLQDMAFYDAMDSIGREVAEVKAPSSYSSSSSDSSWSDSSWSDGGGGGGGFSDSGGGSDSGSGGSFID